MSDRLRAVLVGCGSIAGTWLDAIRDNPDVEIVGLVDLREEAALGRKDAYGLESAIVDTDLDRALDKTAPDVVFDCTIPESHVKVTLAALERGCHVLGEKPLADTMENARVMVEAANRAGRIYAVIQNRRYEAKIRAYRSLIASGRLGELTTLNCDFYIGAHFGGFRDRMEHVLLLDMAIHTFDMARFISGADAVAVYCKEWNPRGSWYDHDASAVAIFEMTNGIIYTYRGSWCAEGMNTSWESQWRAVCDRGSALWDGHATLSAQAVKSSGAFFSEWEDVDAPEPADAKTGSHRGVIEEFLRSVRTGAVPETVCSDNISSLAMVFGAIESARTGKRVEIT